MAPGGFGDVPAEHSPPLGRGMRMGKPADITIWQKPARQADCRCQLGCLGNEVGKMPVFAVRQWPAGSTAGVPGPAGSDFVPGRASRQPETTPYIYDAAANRNQRAEVRKTGFVLYVGFRRPNGRMNSCTIGIPRGLGYGAGIAGCGIVSMAAVYSPRRAARLQQAR